MFLLSLSRDVEISESKARELYWDLCLDVRRLFHDCQLVHGDLSEYNLLYHGGKAYVIDVSQSVEHDHPNALEFLRKDLANLTDFFGRKGVGVMGMRALFDFVVDPTFAASGEEAEKRLADLNEVRAADKQQVEEEDGIFKQIYIPRTLDEVRKKIDFSRGQ